MLGSLILYLKGMRRMMFQLSGFYCRPTMAGCMDPPGKLLASSLFMMMSLEEAFCFGVKGFGFRV